MGVIVSAVKKRLQTIVFRSYPENAAHVCSFRLVFDELV